MNKKDDIKIMLADDNEVLRKEICSLLARCPGMKVVAEAADGTEALQLALEHSPDLVIMDVSMPVLNGIEATRRIREALPGTKIIALSMHSGHRYVREMLGAGASGYILKDCSFEELPGAIETVMKGNRYLSAQLALPTEGHHFGPGPDFENP